MTSEGTGSNEPDPQEGTLDGESLTEEKKEEPDTQQKEGA